MRYVSREAASISEELWSQIAATVVNTARAVPAARRFLSVFGPLRADTGCIPIDDREMLVIGQDMAVASRAEGAQSFLPAARNGALAREAQRSDRRL